jgi:hypothetical protein
MPRLTNVTIVQIQILNFIRCRTMTSSFESGTHPNCKRYFHSSLGMQPCPKTTSWTLKGYSHSTSQTTLLSPLNLTVVESAPRQEGVQLKEQPQADSIHRAHPTAFHTNVQRDPRTKLFLNTCLAGVEVIVSFTLKQVSESWILNARVWIGCTWKFPLQILARGLFISDYFKGCDWPPFCEWQGGRLGNC